MGAIQVVVINGLSGSGKSTFCQFCKEYADAHYEGLKVYELSTIDLPKKIARSLGWNGIKNKKSRIFLHELKMAMTRYNNLPINYIFSTIKETQEKYEDDILVFFVNSREPKDINNIMRRCKQLGYEAKTLVIRKPSAGEDEVGALKQGIINFPYDEIISNDAGIFELRDKAKLFIETMLNRIKL